MDRNPRRQDDPQRLLGVEHLPRLQVRLHRGHRSPSSVLGDLLSGVPLSIDDRSKVSPLLCHRIQNSHPVGSVFRARLAFDEDLRGRTRQRRTERGGMSAQRRLAVGRRRLPVAVSICASLSETILWSVVLGRTESKLTVEVGVNELFMTLSR